MAKKKKEEMKVIPIIRGINQNKGERRVIALHYHPDQIRQSLKEMHDMAEEQEVKNLLVDVAVLVGWALDRLPLVAPPEAEAPASEEKPASEAEASDTGEKV